MEDIKKTLKTAFKLGKEKAYTEIIEEFNKYSQDNYDIEEIISILKEMQLKGD